MELQARYAEFVASANSIAVDADGATAHAAALSASLMDRLLDNRGRLGIREAGWKEHSPGTEDRVAPVADRESALAR